MVSSADPGNANMVVLGLLQESQTGALKRKQKGWEQLEYPTKMKTQKAWDNKKQHLQGSCWIFEYPFCNKALMFCFNELDGRKKCEIFLPATNFLEESQ